MIDPKEPLQFYCFDDAEENQGWGYNTPELREEEEEDIDLENDYAYDEQE
jgi:hypothetical protein